MRPLVERLATGPWLAAATPAPHPSQSTEPALLPTNPTSARSWWHWFTGVPLRILLILVISGVVLVVLRVLINTLTDHIAKGIPTLRSLGESERAAALLGTNPVAGARRAQRARTIGSVLRSTAGLVVGAMAVFLVLDALGVNLAPFIASAGIVGVAVGFGAQSLVKDTLTGLFMLVEDQYGVGDVVDVGPATGTVEAVGLRVTRLRDAEGTLWYVPNGSMVRVGNKTQGWATATVEIDVDYFQDLDQVRSLLQQAAAHVVADPHVRDWVEGEPSVRGIERLSADAVTLQLTVRTAPARQWEVARRLRRAARDVLQRNDVPLGGQRDAMAARLAARSAATGPGATDPAGDAGSPSTAADRQPSPAEADADAMARDPHRTPVEEAVEPHPTGPASDAGQQPPEGPTR